MVSQFGMSFTPWVPMQGPLQPWTPPPCTSKGSLCKWFFVKSSCATTTTTTAQAASSFCYSEDEAQAGAAYFNAEVCGQSDTESCVFNNEHAAHEFCNKNFVCVGVEMVSQFGMSFTPWVPMQGPLQPWTPPPCTSKGSLCKWFFVKSSCAPTTTTTTQVAPSFCYSEDKAQAGAAYFNAEVCGQSDTESCVFNNEHAAHEFCNKNSACVGVEMVSQF